MKPATLLVRGGRLTEDPHGATSVPIYQTATFAQESALGGGEYDYSRSGNPTRAALEQQLADLEGASRACAFASGMAALSTLLRLAPGNRIVAGDDLYGGCWRLLMQVAVAGGTEVIFVDTTDVEAVRTALAGIPALVLLETPTNPLLRVTDLSAVAQICRESAALLAVDNSLMSPLLQRPLELGADLVVHSATKFLGGHGDLTAGVIAARDPELGERVAFFQSAEGNALAPFDCWLLLRGMKTLSLRLREQQRNAALLAAELKTRDGVLDLIWPGLPDFRDREIHDAQCSGPGAVLCFRTGSVERSLALVDALQLYTVAVSFGGVASQASLPCRMSHASIPEEVRRARALPEDLIRIAVGVEDGEDLLVDLQQALDRVGLMGQLALQV